MAHLLVVDDEQSICWGLSRLGRQMGCTVAVAACAEDAFVMAQDKAPDAVVLDVRLPGMDGLTALDRFREEFAQVPVIVITAYGELATAVRAVRNGAFDYLTKPFDLKVAERAIERALKAPKPGGQSLPPATLTQGEPLIGSSPPMQEVFKKIALVAPSEACVHLRGESGTGKELVARAIHRFSRRSEGPFVAVNAASLTPSLAESELFGHARGAFTGAAQPHKGLLERAHGGTIFFDEVADIPPDLQVKLLRVLEHGEILPVGADRPVQSDFRVISATHQNLAQRVVEDSFRHDLYYRLITFEIELPPLRERGDDVFVLAERFLDMLSAQSDIPRPTLSEEVRTELKNRPWYGNVRELRNAVEHAMILARGGHILSEHLPPSASSTTDSDAVGKEALVALIRQWADLELQLPDRAGDLYERLLKLVEPPLLKAVMEQCHGQCAAAARELGLHRTTLRKKLDDLNIDGR